ncbi:hypothetical protein [Streptomyces nanshensis]|uniref:hypothetical protein n=1 Tax=Streptomyces nanshensis TaxID=518642 RepID=UPI00114D00EC|nr:hypothetical protein [Streptomyces nanshensis]
MPLDFDWPLSKTWDGFLMPDRYDEDKCPDCKNGYSPQAQNLLDLWYGRLPFNPQSTGSTPLRHDTPAVRAFAERNVSRAPEFYGTGEAAIVREGQRLADLWNRSWSHHLTQDDVNALVDAGRLMDFTHTWSREGGWQAIDPPVVPTAEQVNEWSLGGFGHDGINTGVVIRARCEREGFNEVCPTCQGHSTLEKYPGQRAEAEAWEATGPPEGEGWQLWETVTEGSPISPVFASADALADWMSDPERGDQWVPAETARKFIDEGWAPTGIGSPARGYVSGVEAVGWRES